MSTLRLLGQVVGGAIVFTVGMLGVMVGVAAIGMVMGMVP